MELEQYLEKDIITFLDSKITKSEKSTVDREEDYGLYLTRDYLKEISYALDNDELTKAKKLFDELKENYMSLPKSSTEKKKIYSILEKMYERIQNYVKIKEGKIEVIRQGDSVMFIDKTPQEEKTDSKKPKGIEENHNTKNISEPIAQTASETRINSPINNTDKIMTDKKGRVISDKTASVETNILKQSIKPIKTTSYYAEKSDTPVSDEITTQNVFSKEPEMNKGTTEQAVKESSEKKRPGTKITKEYEYEKIDLEHLKADIVDKIVSQIETMKESIGEKVYDSVSKSIYEDKKEFEKTIEDIKHEMMLHISEEIKRNSEESRIYENGRIERVRKELMTKVKSNPTEWNAKDSSEMEDKKISITNDRASLSKERYLQLDSIPSEDVIAVPKHKEIYRDTESVSRGYSDNDIRIIYEQAVYEMFDNKYEDAARLFKKIIEVQPNNKAAMIRLSECIEKNPEIARTEDVASEETIKKIPKEEKFQEKENRRKREYDIEEFKDNIHMHLESMTRKIEKINRNKFKHKYSEDEIQEMYEHALETMYKNDYSEATKIFEKILEIRPENKAAKIRLQECMEASGNA